MLNVCVRLLLLNRFALIFTDKSIEVIAVIARILAMCSVCWLGFWLSMAAYICVHVCKSNFADFFRTYSIIDLLFIFFFYSFVKYTLYFLFHSVLYVHSVRLAVIYSYCTLRNLHPINRQLTHSKSKHLCACAHAKSTDAIMYLHQSD